MKLRYLTPGPTELHPAVPRLIEEALSDDVYSISHRSSAFEAIFEKATSGLRELLGIPASHHVLFLSSGTEGMERAVQSLAAERTHHFVNGAFSDRFFKTARELGKRPTMAERPAGQGFLFEEEEVPDDAEVLCVTHNETSTGVLQPGDSIEVLKHRFPGKLLAVDIVSSAPFIDFDLGCADFAFFSVQKGFGLPAGLGIAVVSPAGVKKSQALEKGGLSTGSYHSLSSLLATEKKRQTPETPNVLALHLLGGVCAELLRDGREQVMQATRARAERIYTRVPSMPGLKLFVEDARFRSPTVIAVSTGGRCAALDEALRRRGIVAGSGYGKFSTDHLRIANFPMHKDSDFDVLLEVLAAEAPR